MSSNSNIPLFPFSETSMDHAANIITKYFPDLTPNQLEQFSRLKELYESWNEKINVISRNDISHLYERHVLFSLSLAKIIQFRPGTQVLDIGTGGGFPGIPLAILFPDVHFHLVDSIGKKIMVVNEVASALQVKNVTAEKIRGEELRQQFDFIVSRAVTTLTEIYSWTKGKIKAENRNDLANGILYLKGGDLAEEVAQLKKKTVIYELKDFFEEPFFETKKIVYLPLK